MGYWLIIGRLWLWYNQAMIELIKKLFSKNTAQPQEINNIAEVQEVKNPYAVDGALSLNTDIFGTLKSRAYPTSLLFLESVEKIPIPFLGDQKCLVTLHNLEDDLVTQSIENGIKTAEIAFTNFLIHTNTQRMKTSKYILKNCEDFFDGIYAPGYKENPNYIDEEDKWFSDVKKPEQIWQHVSKYSINILKEDGNDAVFVVVTAECAWDTEHGLQIVFENGKKLVRISQQGGQYSSDDDGDGNAILYTM